MLAAPSPDSTPTLAAYAEHWLDAIRGTVRTHTIERYRYVLWRYVLPALGRRSLDELTRAEVKHLLGSLLARGLAPLTVRAVHAVIQALLNFAIDDELVTRNVALRLGRRLHRRTRERPALDVGQLNLFLSNAAAMAPRQYPLFVAMAAGGLRVGEAIALRPMDIDETRPIIHVRRTMRHGGGEAPPKSGRSRRVLVTETAISILRAVPEDPSGWLFPGRKGTKPIGYTHIADLTKKIAKRCGLPLISPKTFRRSYAGVMKQHGASIAWLADQFGHHSTAITERSYTDGLEAEPPAILRR